MRFSGPRWGLWSVLLVSLGLGALGCQGGSKAPSSEMSKLKELCKLDAFERDLKATFSTAIFDEMDAFAKEEKRLNAWAESLEKKQRTASRSAFKKEVARFEREGKAFKVRIDAFNEQLERFRQWGESGKELRFFNRVNDCYARLRSIERRDGSAFKWGNQLGRAKAIREQLLEHRLRLDSGDKSGTILVRVRIGSEVGVYVLDTGASLVTISPEMVLALGWEDRKGESITMTLAGGKREQSPKISLAEVEVQGHTRKNVEGVVLGASGYGVDGLLGQSFLSQFELKTDPAKNPKFTLTPK